MKRRPTESILIAAILLCAAAFAGCSQDENGRKTYNLVVNYLNGTGGVEKNPEKAIRLFQKAAENGVASAMYNLGLCYYNGDGVEKDLAKAVEWYQKAAENGDANALEIIRAGVDADENGDDAGEDDRKTDEIEWE